MLVLYFYVYFYLCNFNYSLFFVVYFFFPPVCEGSLGLSVLVSRTIILPVVLYGCETWSLTLREERKLRVLENMVLRIFGPRRDEVTGE